MAWPSSTPWPWRWDWQCSSSPWCGSSLGRAISFRRSIVAFRSAKGRPFAERKATLPAYRGDSWTRPMNIEFLLVLLLCLLAVPAVAAAVVALLGPRRLDAIRWVSLGSTLASLLLTICLVAGYVGQPGQ